MDGRMPRVVLLAADCAATRIVYHGLKREFPDTDVVLERPVPRWQFLRNRGKKLGLATAAGQALFMVFLVPLLRRTGVRRIEAIKHSFGLDDSPIGGTVIHVPSVNSDEARQALRRLKPKVVVVNGTRIIGRETLNSIPAPFINTHAGITPLYRGVHGGYWALAEGRPDLAGTTVHLVDEGVDTGTIIEQVHFRVTSADSFVTYPYLHTAVGVPILIRAVRDALESKLQPRRDASTLPSKLRTHPTLTGYMLRRVTRGVR
jgi:formyl transferase-like protein